MPSALDTFADAAAGAAAEAVEYPPAVSRLAGHPALMAAKWRELSGRCPEAIGGADLAAFRWAHTVRMSLHALQRRLACACCSTCALNVHHLRPRGGAPWIQCHDVSSAYETSSPTRSAS